MKYLRYLKYVLVHKFWVAVYGRQLNVFWLALLHDNSKFRPDEFGPYTDFFYGPKRQSPRDKTGYYKPTDTGDAAFDFAWLLHQKRNKHHWQWWIRVPLDFHVCLVSSESSAITATASSAITATVRIGLLDIVPFDEGGVKCMRCGEVLPEDEGVLKILPMPDRYRREMLADWRGAGMAQGKPDTLGWYKANRHKMSLHPETRQWIEDQLGYSR